MATDSRRRPPITAEVRADHLGGRGGAAPPAAPTPAAADGCAPRGPYSAAARLGRLDVAAARKCPISFIPSVVSIKLSVDDFGTLVSASCQAGPGLQISGISSGLGRQRTRPAALMFGCARIVGGGRLAVALQIFLSGYLREACRLVKFVAVEPGGPEAGDVDEGGFGG